MFGIVACNEQCTLNKYTLLFRMIFKTQSIKLNLYIGQQQYYWAGSRPSFGCACGYHGDCSSLSVRCNCDIDDVTARSDAGHIDEPQKLPLKAVASDVTTGSGGTEVTIVVHPVTVINI